MSDRAASDSKDKKLPPPRLNQVYCDVSALEAGIFDLPSKLFVAGAADDEIPSAPSLAFLLQHSFTKEYFLFDLGIRQDPENFPPPIQHTIGDRVRAGAYQDVCASLAKGGLQPDQIPRICLSHLHWDHIGDTQLWKSSDFLVGAGSRVLLDPGYPEDPNSPFPSDMLPSDRTRYLSPDSTWEQVGPFPRAFDFYGDGSLYIVDAPGHLPGHLNVLARTSPDGGWIYLAGDSAHDWRLITGEADIATNQEYKGFYVSCMHVDTSLAKEQMRRIRELMQLPRVRVILTHDIPWFEENKGGEGFWPGVIKSL